MRSKTKPHATATPPTGEPAADDLRAVLHALPAAVLLVDAAGSVRFRNDSARRWFRKTGGLTATLSAVRSASPVENWQAEVARVIESGEPRRYEASIRADGEAAATLVTIECLPVPASGTGRADLAIVFVVETSRHEAADSQLDVSNRLASLGKLAARVAHELSNPLDGILRYVNLALRVADDVPEDRLKSYLSESRTGLMRMVHIIGDLLEYSRSTDGAFDSVGINEVIEQAIRSQSAAADARGIVISADFQSQTMPAVGGTRLYQVVCNLIKNAIDAMPGGGCVSIATGLTDNEVVIRVADTGVGLPDDVEALFEPFYTTKAPGKGSGLGLAICREFIEGMAGRITASPGEDGGAVFTVRIPISACRKPSPLGTIPPVETS